MVRTTESTGPLLPPGEGWDEGRFTAIFPSPNPRPIYSKSDQGNVTATQIHNYLQQ